MPKVSQVLAQLRMPEEQVESAIASMTGMTPPTGVTGMLLSVAENVEAGAPELAGLDLPALGLPAPQLPQFAQQGVQTLEVPSEPLYRPREEMVITEPEYVPEVPEEPPARRSLLKLRE